MNKIAHKKVEKRIFITLSQIITEDLHNSKLTFPTLTAVELSPDKSILKAYLAFASYPKQSLEIIEEAKKFIRFELAKRAQLRKTPEIIFKIDDSFERGHKIDRILEKLKSEK